VVLVGQASHGYSVNQFGPKTLTVAQGATVTFRGNWLEPHTVTFTGTEPMPTSRRLAGNDQTAPGVNTYDGTSSRTRAS
jgi:plastocyanin